VKKLETEMNNDVTTLARAIADEFAKLPDVRAVTLGGSHATGKADPNSDLDLYVFSRKEIPVETRAAIIEPRASQMQLDNRFYETEDYWIEKIGGRKVEVIYRGAWLEEHLKNLLENYQAQLGYTTSLWHNVLQAVILFERDSYFSNLQQRVRVPYPDGLVKAIIAKNFPLLKGSLAAHSKELYKALARGDGVTVHHRIEAMLASYLDILFALNHELHPGEKRSLMHAETLALQPKHMKEDVEALLTERKLERVQETVERLLGELIELLEARGLL
jgi:predicted nucleotidyltransferase